MLRKMKRKIIPYQPWLKKIARKLRNNSTKSEIKLWNDLKGRKMMGYDFHRQKPLKRYIVDFYCRELDLVIELDGFSHFHSESFDKDRIRQEELEKLDLTVLRFEDEEVFDNYENVLRSIEYYIVEFERMDESIHP